ncbi:MAG: tryptophan synthase subunit alpha [Deinococcales bacterium]
MNRVQAAFSGAAARSRAAFIGYLPAGFPTSDGFHTAADTILEYADALEIGLPYSDPLGDGPTIQKAGEKALANGMTVAGTFAAAKALRARTDKALFVMTYYNPILATGEEAFVQAALESGVDGLILPDLPPDEADTLIPLAREAGIKLTFLLAPTSTKARIELVADSSTGFIYAVSVTGVTGARAGIPEEVPQMLQSIKAATDKPVAVGFGVSSFETAQAVARVADGVVVGSALVTAAERGQGLSELCQEILRGCSKS